MIVQDALTRTVLIDSAGDSCNLHIKSFGLNNRRLPTGDTETGTCRPFR